MVDPLFRAEIAQQLETTARRRSTQCSSHGPSVACVCTAFEAAARYDLFHIKQFISKGLATAPVWFPDHATARRLLAAARDAKPADCTRLHITKLLRTGKGGFKAMPIDCAMTFIARDISRCPNAQELRAAPPHATCCGLCSALISAGCRGGDATAARNCCKRRDSTSG